jgi:hypothetical protein
MGGDSFASPLYAPGEGFYCNTYRLEILSAQSHRGEEKRYCVNPCRLSATQNIASLVCIISSIIKIFSPLLLEMLDLLTVTPYSVVSPGSVEKVPHSCALPSFSANLADEIILNVPAV